MHNAIFEQVNQQLNSKVHWMPLSQLGTSNWLYKGSNGRQVLVLRINASDELVFGVSREREACVLQQLADCDWAMSVICNRPDLGWCVMRHHGLGLGPEALPDPLAQHLLRAIESLQQLPLPEAELRQVALISYPSLFQAYQRCLNRETDPVSWLELLNRLVQLFTSLPEVPESYTHHDLHPGNCCWQDGRLVLIDWEYAGIGNPWFDAAGLYRYCGIDVQLIHRLPAFCHLSPSMFELGLQQAQDAMLILERLWYKVRG
ncbi:phosphotransferase family protein [Oceanospirillum sp.]|uniref:phosphotransferase family protein n=1 Tax=Oceanospirillum sp. TaxID=2021254 RepID=UPI003A8D7F12